MRRCFKPRRLGSIVGSGAGGDGWSTGPTPLVFEFAERESSLFRRCMAEASKMPLAVENGGEEEELHTQARHLG